MSAGADVIFHDLECGGYLEDLPLWRELAGAGPVLDIGCGTGRVALDLAARGVPVVGLDRDPVLLEAMTARGDGLPLEAVCADARDFDLGRTFPVALAPMQTVQLLGGRSERERFLRCAREHVEPGGLFAIAVADAIESFDEITATPPLPDVRENGGTVYFSQPVAVHDEGERFAVHFVREIVDPDGGRTSGRVLIHLDRVDPGELEAEAAALGFTALERRTVPATDAYVGSAVVMLGG
jgi:SAM-dependent methyltransferase